MGGGLKYDIVGAEVGRTSVATRSILTKGPANPSLGNELASLGAGEPSKPRKFLSGSDSGKLKEDPRSVEGLDQGPGGRTSVDITVKGRPILDKAEYDQLEEADKNATNAQAREETFEKGKIGEKRKKQKPIKKKKFEANLVLGMDVQIEDALEVAECTLVGRARRKSYSGQFIKQWAEQQWKTTPVKSFKVSALVKGWFMVRFENKEAAD